MRFGLEEKVIEKINFVFASFPKIHKVIIYGSRAKGNYREGSDIDLTLIGEGLDLSVLNAVDTKLDDLLLPYLFDISIFEQITNSDLVNHINRVGKLMYEKQ